MKWLAWILGGVVLALALAYAVFLAVGPDRVWRLIAGDPDLGPTTFETFTRPGTPNVFLVCPQGVCGAARPDLVSPVYDAPPEETLAATIAVVGSLPRAERVDDGGSPRKARFVVRSRFMRFPDTLSIEVYPVGEGAAPDGPRSAVAILSRSQLGRNDLGVNAARVRGILDRLAARLPVERPARPSEG